MRDFTRAGQWHCRYQSPTLIHIKQPDNPFPSSLAGKIVRRDIFDDSFARDLKTLIERFGGQIRDRTHVYWHGDEHHVRGGYECTFREPGAEPIAAALAELDLLYDLVSAALIAAGATSIAANMMDG
ncbi:hypothetical protein JSE7799_02638 [Jannaschia seosinensis]|uniref:Uncharacterized protein n=1 Tax=Jannaschia seosinensis TaxID=313367 RepID=A0A0M7BAZ9_9RHOB|nr:hypothetical protein [Jannaschia seosinensis]CUH39910.1 hypothetical protein JSE7799_02638 [Jannaschia seosinensis]